MLNSSFGKHTHTYHGEKGSKLTLEKEINNFFFFTDKRIYRHTAFFYTSQNAMLDLNLISIHRQTVSSGINYG